MKRLQKISIGSLRSDSYNYALGKGYNDAVDEFDKWMPTRREIAAIIEQMKDKRTISNIVLAICERLEVK